MSVMNSLENVALIGGAALGTTMLLGKASEMDSDKLREIGEKVSGVVDTVGDKVSEAAKKLMDKTVDGEDKGSFLEVVKAKIADSPKLSGIFSAVSHGGQAISQGITKMWDGIVAAKEQSEQDGSSFAGNLMHGLMDSVSNAAEYAAEKAKDYLGLDGADEPDAGAPEADGPEAEDEGTDFEMEAL